MLNLITFAVFIFVVAVVWLSARALLKPRPIVATAPGLSDWNLSGAKVEPSPLVESLAGQLPQALFAREELDKDFRRAGYYRPNASRRFLAFRNGLVILAVLATGIAAVAIGPGRQEIVIWTLIGGAITAILCYAVPRVVLAINARRRVEQIRDALPDAMDTISMCLYGGISLQECLGHVGEELMSVHPDLGLELQIVGRQADINSFDFAIGQFASRIDAPEIVAMASMITQNRRLGTGIIDSFRDFADSVRLKRRQLAEAKASRTELFLLFPVIFCLVPSILLLLWGPPILALIDFLGGPASPLSTGI